VNTELGSPEKPLWEQARFHEGFEVNTESVSPEKPLWEQGLPAMAAAHSAWMQADPALSRASPLPQGI
jgi:hypothetical protein